MDNSKTMIAYIGEPAMLEQMAEEAVEFAKAALKLARIERAENPTPVTKDAAIDQLLEEYTDVVQCALELGIKENREQMKKKRERFLQRQAKIDEAKNPRRLVDPKEIKRRPNGARLVDPKDVRTVKDIAFEDGEKRIRFAVRPGESCEEAKKRYLDALKELETCIDAPIVKEHTEETWVFFE